MLPRINKGHPPLLRSRSDLDAARAWFLKRETQVRRSESQDVEHSASWLSRLKEPNLTPLQTRVLLPITNSMFFLWKYGGFSWLARNVATSNCAGQDLSE